jgi:hypothetical protein
MASLLMLCHYSPPSSCPVQQGPLLMPHSVVGVREVQVSVCSFLGENNHTNNTTGAAIPLDGLPQSSLDEVDRIVLLHALSPVGVTVAVDVSRSGSTNGIRLLVERTTQRNGVDLTTESLIPTSNNQTGTTEGG